MKYHFLSHALYNLEPAGLHDTELDSFLYATEGMHFYYDEDRIIGDFMSGSKDTSRIYLHSVLHCLYLHPYFALQYENHELWDLACDLFVWDILDHLQPSDDRKMRSRLDDVKKTGSIMSAQMLYKMLDLMIKNKMLSRDDIKMAKNVTLEDDHILWYMPKRAAAGAGSGPKGQGSDNAASNYMAGNFTSVIRKWQKSADHAVAGLESALLRSGRLQGRDPGALVESLKGIRREEISYADFLRKFAAIEERMMIDDDSFDYGYYTYGFQLYEDMPLVEPLEYRELHTIREFVIAVDTSGSVDSDLLKRFLTKTYNILKESVFAEDGLDVRIIQCDAAIQNETIIHNDRDLEDYINDLKVYGRGGTDFRPVFEHIEEVRNNGELKNLRGLLYFTDGMGTYPKHPASYKTAFILSEPRRDPYVPSWILQYQLREDFTE